MSGSRPVLSIVVPFYNEEETAVQFAGYVDELRTSISSRYGLDLEVVLIDDGSRDRSIELYRQHMQGNWRIIELSRNFGKEVALYAGVEATTGDYVMMIDADLQHPISVCLEMLDRLMAEPDLDGVYTIRDDRHTESMKKEAGAFIFYWLMNFRQRFTVPANAGDFRLMRRPLADAFLKLKDRRRFNKGLYAWTGFRQAGILYRPAPRAGSVSRWSKLALIDLSIEGITSFSVLPLRLASLSGLLAAVAGFLYGVKILLEVALSGVAVPGYPSIMVAVALFGGLNLMLLGLIGEYLWVGVSEAKDRPLYLVRRVHEPGQGS